MRYVHTLFLLKKVSSKKSYLARCFFSVMLNDLFVVDRTRSIVVKYVDDLTLGTCVRKEDDIADSMYFSKIDQFWFRAVRCGYLKEATLVNELTSDKRGNKSQRSELLPAGTPRALRSHPLILATED